MSREDQNTEWKESWRDEYLKWICGFANAQGGRLVIGKNDLGKVVGLADAEDLLEELPIQIRVYEDTIRFYNCGCLPDGWTVKKLMRKHKSKPNNPLIAGAFFRSGDIEAWGRGIETIADACHEHGVDLPTFESEPTGMTVEFKGEVLAEQKPERAGKVQDKFKKGLGKSSGKILELLEQNGELTIPQLAERIGITPRAIEKNIKKLQETGLLRRIGGRKEGHWEVLEGEREESGGAE